MVVIGWRLPVRLNWIGEWNQSESFETPRNGVEAHRQANRFARASAGTPHQKILIGAVVAFSGLIGTTFAIQSLYASQPQAPAKSVVVEKQPLVEMVDVLVPVRAIEPGKPLDPAMFMRVKRPALAVSDGVLRNIDQVRGLYARTTIPSGQMLHKDFATTVRPSNPIAQVIPDGFRAVSINVSATSGVEGWARAGARVDVSWVTESEGQRVATVIVQNAKVLSAERQIDPAGDQKKDAPIPTTVTLLATDKDAKRISFAATDGQLVLLLRGAEDSGKSSSATGSISYGDLLGQSSPTDSNGRIQGFVRIGGKGTVANEEFVLFNDGKLIKKGSE